MDRVRAHPLHLRLLRVLRALQRPDGGFPVSEEGRSEVEPTAVAAIALRDEPARTWLAARQRADGGFAELDGRVDGPTTGALVALALDDDRRARRALRYAIERRGLPLPNAADPERRVGWGWTADARSLTEPTARVLLAVNAVTPADRRTRAEAVGLLAERQCNDGGWNFGNASVYDVDLRGYAQTTAFALIALQGERAAMVGPGLAFLRARWRDEPGGLTAAQALIAFRLHGATADAAAVRDALDSMAAEPDFVERPLTVAWAALATGPDALLDPLRSRR